MGLCRNFTQSRTCMEEFSQAYHQVMEGRLNYLVVVLLQRPIRHDLPPELETYLKTHTYIDAQKYPNNIETIRKRIRFAMPNTPLRILKVSMVRVHHILMQKDPLTGLRLQFKCSCIMRASNIRYFGSEIFLSATVIFYARLQKKLIN